MLGLAEYIASSRELLSISQQTEAEITKQMGNSPAKQQAIQIAQDQAWEYQDQYRELLQRSMTEVAQNAVEHYSSLLGIEPSDELVRDIVVKQFDYPYHGASLSQRLSFNFMRLNSAISKSAQVKPEYVARAWTQTIPFGAHYNIDRRVLLGTLVKIENDAARATATSADIQLIRWTLSHAHSQPDECDDLASAVDPKVEEYLKKGNFDMDPAGVYFVEDLPDPPHPNCRCEYGMVMPNGEVKHAALHRAIHKLTSVLRRLRRR